MTKVNLFTSLFLFLLSFQAQAQGFLMSHFFKPGMKIGTEYQLQSPLRTDNALDIARGRLGFSVPIKSKLGLAIKPNDIPLKDVFDLKKWKNIPKNLSKVIQPKAHQVFWNFNTYYNYLNTGSIFYQLKENPAPAQAQRMHLYGANTGVTGFHYLRKARILFYSANIGFLEDKYSVKELRPTANALIGFAQVTSLHSVLYVAAYAAYADKRVLPVPVLGFDTRLKKGLRLNVTLPVQAKLTWKKKKNSYSALVSLAGFFSGLGEPNLTSTRAAQTVSYLKTGFQYNRKIGKNARLILEGGWADWRRVSQRQTLERNYRIAGSPYLGATFHRTFGKALFDGSLGNFLN